MTKPRSGDDQAAVNGRPHRGQTLTRPWSSLRTVTSVPGARPGDTVDQLETELIGRRLVSGAPVLR